VLVSHLWILDPVEANTKVYFIGSQCGRQTGEINAARALFCLDDGIISEEWVVVPHEQNSNMYRGASGATIIRESDNKAVGHLCSCTTTEDTQLAFIPMNVLLDNIKKELQANYVRLPPIPMHRSSPSPEPISTMPRQVTQVCLIKATSEEPKIRKISLFRYAKSTTQTTST
jgi:hypothetical protein